MIGSTARFNTIGAKNQIQMMLAVKPIKRVGNIMPRRIPKTGPSTLRTPLIKLRIPFTNWPPSKPRRPALRLLIRPSTKVNGNSISAAMRASGTVIPFKIGINAVSKPFKITGMITNNLRRPNKPPFVNNLINPVIEPAINAGIRLPMKPLKIFNGNCAKSNKPLMPRASRPNNGRPSNRPAPAPKTAKAPNANKAIRPFLMKFKIPVIGESNNLRTFLANPNTEAIPTAPRIRFNPGISPGNARIINANNGLFFNKSPKTRIPSTTVGIAIERVKPSAPSTSGKANLIKPFKPARANPITPPIN